MSCESTPPCRSSIPPITAWTPLPCAEVNPYVLITQEVYADIHPNLVTIPLKSKYAMPYGLMYAKHPSDAVKQFIDAAEKSTDASRFQISRITFAGFPTAMLLSGISFVTTLPVPMIAFPIIGYLPAALFTAAIAFRHPGYRCRVRTGILHRSGTPGCSYAHISAGMRCQLCPRSLPDRKGSRR